MLVDTRSLRQERTAVVDAVHECLKLGGVEKLPHVRDYGHYRDPSWRGEDGELMPHLSVDWYIVESWNNAKEKINGARLLSTLQEEPWRKEEFLGDHYDVWVVDQEIYDETHLDGDSSVVGMSLPSVGIVLSAWPFDSVGLPTYGLLKTAALHELGHLFGLPSISRDDVAFDAGVHCTNCCVMRSAGAEPERWIELTQDRLMHGSYCDSCTAELRAHLGG